MPICTHFSVRKRLCFSLRKLGTSGGPAGSCSNAKWATWCFSVSTGHIRAHWALWYLHGVQIWELGWQHIHQYPIGGSFVGLWECSCCSSLHKGAYAVLLLCWSSSVALFDPRCVAAFLLVAPPHSSACALEMQQIILQQHEWRSWIFCATWKGCQ